MLTQPIPIDQLSPAALHVIRMNEDQAYLSLLPKDGSGPVEARDVLETLKPAEALQGTVMNHNAAACVVAGLWLWHDFLDAADEIVQSVETPTGSFWHAVMHRREGDFSNAKYWYRRVGSHPAFTSLASRTNELTQGLPADKSLLRLSAAGWNPSAWVDLCEAVSGEGSHPHLATVQAIQRAEWQALFSATVREALGK